MADARVVDVPEPDPIRRRFLQALAALGIGTPSFQRAVAFQAGQGTPVTPEMIRQAEWIAGLDLTDDERRATARAVQQLQRSLETLRSVDVGHDVAPCLHFNPAPWLRPASGVARNRARVPEPPVRERPDDESLAFLPVVALSGLVRSRRVSSVELTRLYLSRLKKYDGLLKCVVSLTEDLAIAQAERADAEIAAGKYRGPLHGIPWGAKDLIAVPGYRTTWGATPFQDQTIDTLATVAERLEEAGAVLVAKLSLGALAMGDRWFGGMTRNPWDPRRGSSGSSAGSASAVSAGLVGFAIGSETLGSIVSPSQECGCTGLRPTFGRVSRAGCMALSWSMDKLGPLCRSAEDCALVLDAIHGWDGGDGSAVDQPFDWPPPREIRGLRVGYLKAKEPGPEPKADRPELTVLRELGVDLVPIDLPRELPASAVTLMLGTEAGAAFDAITRRHVTEGLNSWPTSFRRAQFVPAVEYLRAARVRTMVMRSMADLMATIDLYISNGEDLEITNLTGHPCVALPVGFGDPNGNGRQVPRVMTITGRLFDESTLLGLAAAYQRATDFHRRRPPINLFLNQP